VFFLLYCGKGGYTQESIDRMTMDELLAHGERLQQQLREEKAAHEREMARVRAKQSSQAARARFRRR